MKVQSECRSLSPSAALDRESDWYHWLAANTSDGVWRLDLARPMPADLAEDERVAWVFEHAIVGECNGAMARMLGFGDAAELAGLGFAKILPREEPANAAAVLAFVRSCYSVAGAELIWRDRAGRARRATGGLAGVVEDRCVVGVRGIARETAPAREADAAARRTEGRLRELIEQSPLSIQVFTADGRTVIANPAWERLFGATLADLADYNILEDAQLVARGVMPLIERAFEGEAVGIPPIPYAPDRGPYKGKQRWCSAHAFPVLDETGRVDEVVLVHEDVTSWHAAQQKLQLYRELFDHSSDGIAITDPSGVYIEQNPAHRALTGFDEEDLRGRTPAIHLGEAVFAEIARALASEGVWRGEVMSRGKKGRERPVELSAFAVRDAAGEPICYVGVKRDITARREAETALREGEERLHQAMAAGRMGSWQWDLASNVVEWSPELERLHGLEPGGFGGTIEDVRREMHPDDRDRVEGVIRETLEAGADYNVEYRIVRPDGAVRWVEGRGRVFRDGNGRPVRMAGVCADATERKGAVEALRESEERFRAAQELSLDAFMVLRTVRDSGGEISDFVWEYANPIASRVLRAPAEDLVGRSLLEALPGDRETLFPRYVGVVETGRPHDIEIRSNADGADRWFRNMAVRLGDGVAVYFSDITERKHAEESLAAHRDRLEHLVQQRTEQLETSHQQLRLSERMAALGTLAAGLGHDMGNLLLPIRTRLDILRSKALPAGLGQDLAAIGQCAEYLQSLARGLRLFALDPEDASASGGSTDLGSWWGEAAPFFRSTLGKGIPVEPDLPPNLPAVAIAPHRLTQVVLNLIQNAKDAMGPDRRGRVRVEARALGDGRVRLCVEDDGPGMTPEVRARCLEPFFTTKTRGVSTGLGLSLVHGALQAAGGTVEIDTAPGQGTRFTLTIPAAGGGRGPAAGAIGSAAVLTGNPRLRSMIQTVLRAMRYNIIDPDAEPPDRADLWIVDPAVVGPETARRFLAEGPGRRVVLLGQPGPDWAELNCESLAGPVTPSSLRSRIGRAVRDPASEPATTHGA